MNILLQWLIIIFLFFILLPVVAVCIATAGKFIYSKIKGHKTIGTPKFIVILLISILGLAVIPPISYAVAESSLNDVVITGDIATLNYDENDPDIRYIEYNGVVYKELDTAIAQPEYIDYSSDTGLQFGEPIANIIMEDQTFLEKYIYAVFKYPVYSQLVYPVKNEGLDDCISLEGSALFCKADTFDEKLAYYKDLANYEYYVEDYNEDEYYEIKIDSKSITELNSQYELKFEYEYDETEESIEKTIPGIIKLVLDPDYNILTITGESKDNIFLREVGMIYTDKDGQMYQSVEEFWQDDGSVVLMALKVSDETTKKLTTAFRKAGIPNY